MQLIDALHPWRDEQDPRWTHSPSFGVRNVIEVWVLTLWFVFFAWAGGFEILRIWLPTMTAAVAAVPSAFLILHAGPALAGIIPGIRPAAVSPTGIRRRAGDAG